MTEEEAKEKGWKIGLASYSPAAAFDYEYYHQDFDGVEDANDPRCGRGASVADCLDQIETFLEEQTDAKD